MTLPKRLKAARMTDATLVVSIDDEMGNFESSLADILGYTTNTDIVTSAMLVDNSGRVTSPLLASASTGAIGLRMRDTSNSTEMRIAAFLQYAQFDANVGSEATPAWSNRVRIRMSDGGFSSLVADVLQLTPNTIVLPNQTSHTGVDHGGYTLVRATGGNSTDGNNFFHGFVAGTDGQLLFLIDDLYQASPPATYRLAVTYDSATEPVAANRVLINTAGSYYTAANVGFGGLLFVYDGALQRWVRIGHNIN